MGKNSPFDLIFFAKCSSLSSDSDTFYSISTDALVRLSVSIIYIYIFHPVGCTTPETNIDTST